MKHFAAVALLVVVASHVRADDAADAKAEAVSRIETAKPQLARGGYFDAIANLKKALAADPSSLDAALLLAGAYRDTGEYDKARDAVTPFDKSAAAQTLRAELLLLRGDYEGAESAAKLAFGLDPLALGALIVVGRTQEATGRREDAITTYEDVNRRWTKTKDTEETDDILLADARARLGVFRLSTEHAPDLDSVVSRLEPILKRSPDRFDAFVECGDLYLAAYKDQDAKKWYGKVLEVNPHFAPALFGKARQMAFRYEEVDAAKLCEDQVLRENDSFVPALLFLAQQALGDGDYDKGDGLVKRALAVNPNDAEVCATHAALSYLRGDKDAFETETKAILARDKFAAAAYSVVGHVLEEQRRFAEALAFAEKAVAVDPIDWDAYFLAGRNALNVGEDEKAEKYLKAADKGDPFPNVYRKNFVLLFNQMRNFALRKDAQFVVRMPPAEEEPYYRLLRAAMGASIESLAAKWKFTPEFPIYVAEFSQQADFATRTIGLPGFPALGACFGRVVTLDSPRALPPGAFLWSLCEHHELAHVITLQLSKGRVPRWLTEGISVYEERRVSKTWDRENERDVIDAIASDDILTLKDINGAFRGSRVMFAYYQGGLMCELIERDFGFDKLREMVRLYGEGLDTPAVVKQALGIEPAEFDARFLAYAKDYVKDLRVLRHLTKAKTDKLKRELRKKPDDAEAWLLLCEGCISQGDNPAALSALSNAVKFLPEDGRIPAMRALIAWHERKPELAVQHADEAIAKGTDFFELRMGLADYWSTQGKDAEKAKLNWRRAIELFPLQGGQGDPRVLLAKQLGAEGEKNLDEVISLLRAHVDVDEDDLSTRKALAGMYAQHARPDDELLMLEQMRDIAPLPNAPSRDPGAPPSPRAAAGWPRDAAVSLHERLGEMYMERKRYADAELAYACAVGVARMDIGDGAPGAEPPVVADLLAHHAETLHLLGRADDARARLAEALRLDAENELAKKLQQTLQR
jgi:tetratricopeptide (TPR) repeat protein